MKSDISQVWKNLEARAGSSVVRERISGIDSLHAYIGFIGATGAKMFQLELENNFQVHENYLRKFRGVEIQVIPGKEGLNNFTIILLEESLTDIFVLFIEDVLGNLFMIAKTEDALLVVNQRVIFWQSLFGRVTGEYLSRERQRGLFGELTFLRVLLEVSNQKQTIMNAWQGAQGANQDFVLGRKAVEIKTTKASKPAVHITNEQQLDFEQWRHLYLGLYLVNESAGETNSLKALIREIEHLLNMDSELVRLFRSKLALAGVHEDQIDFYNKTSYSVNSQRFYQVQENFPSITRRTIEHEGIYNIRYQVDIATCDTFRTEPDKVVYSLLDS